MSTSCAVCQVITLILDSYLGKSTGAGGLAVWMHHLKDITYHESLNSSAYNGPAFKLGAGVTGQDLAPIVSNHGHTVVIGECVVRVSRSVRFSI